MKCKDDLLFQTFLRECRRDVHVFDVERIKMRLGSVLATDGRTTQAKTRPSAGYRCGRHSTDEENGDEGAIDRQAVRSVPPSWGVAHAHNGPNPLSGRSAIPQTSVLATARSFQIDELAQGL